MYLWQRVIVIRDFFVLNIDEIINKNASSSAYLIDSIDIWHARLGHANISYIKKM